MTLDQEVCYASLHSKPASPLGLSTVWLLRGNLGMARCWEMSTLQTGYILQCKVTSASSGGSLGFIMNFYCVWSVVGWLTLSLSGPIQSDLLLIADCDDTTFEGTLTLQDPVHWAPSTFLESRSWWGHDCGKQKKQATRIYKDLTVLTNILCSSQVWFEAERD